jgi:hypothetical protein
MTNNRTLADKINCPKGSHSGKIKSFDHDLGYANFFAKRQNFTEKHEYTIKEEQRQH